MAAIASNPAIKVTLTSSGAAIKQIELKQHKEGDGKVILNQNAHSNVLALSGWADSVDFQVEQSNPDSVTYAALLPGTKLPDLAFRPVKPLKVGFNATTTPTATRKNPPSAAPQRLSTPPSTAPAKA